METYFDFDAETFQITEKKRLSTSSGEAPRSPGVSSRYITSTCSEDTGFETCSDRSSQDGVPLLESPRSPCFKSSNGLSRLTGSKTSLDSLVSRPIRRFGSKESINSTSSFWDSNGFSPETKAVLSKIRDQMRSSLEKVKKLEEEAKQVPLLQVKISILQEEKRQLMAQVESRSLRKSRSRGSSTSHSRSSSIDDLFSSFQDKETRSIGVGEDSVHDILCEKCKEIQWKLLGHSYGSNISWCCDEPRATKERRIRPRTEILDDSIKVFQDRCTQTRRPEFQHNSAQAVVLTQDCSTNTNNDENSSVEIKETAIMIKESSCDPMPVETRSVGVGQIKSFLKDVCVGEDREIPSYTDNSVQNVVSTNDMNCGEQIITDNIGVNVCPIMVSISTGCRSDDTMSKCKQQSIACQTLKESINLVSVGVGMFSVDDSDDYECSKCSSEKSLTIDEILESNKKIYQENPSVAVETSTWFDLERQVLLHYQASRSTASVAVETKIDNRTVGCGEQSVTDISCQNCASKTTRSLGISCLPKMSDKAVGDGVPEKFSVGVGECCLTDNYCERCFSLQTRTVAVGSGSVLDTLQTDITTTPMLTDVSLQPLTPPQTPNTNTETKTLFSNKLSETNLPSLARMFTNEYERVETELFADCTDGKSCKDENSSRDDILLTCKLLQRHFMNNDDNLDESKLLLCMKNIEDYWFICVTDERLEKESLADLIRVLEQHLPYLLDGIINSQDEHGNTALHYLVTYGKFDCVNELLKTNHCNVIITNKAGYSAVMLGSLKEAISPKDVVVLKRLFENGNLNCISQSTGQTALMLAAGTGNVDTVNLLLQCGAIQSINTKDLDGSTALMCACEHGYAKVVKRLLAVDGCDATIADHDGSTCFSIAMEHNRKDIALMIYNHIQVQNSKTPNKKK